MSTVTSKLSISGDRILYYCPNCNGERWINMHTYFPSRPFLGPVGCGLCGQQYDARPRDEEITKLIAIWRLKQ